MNLIFNIIFEITAIILLLFGGIWVVDSLSDPYAIPFWPEFTFGAGVAIFLILILSCLGYL